MSATLTYKEIFERIYTENYVRLYYYALHIVNEEETAKDILNDVFTMLWKNISHVESSNVNAYLMTSVRNKAVDYLRHNVLQSHYSEEYLHTFHRQGEWHRHDGIGHGVQCPLLFQE